MPSETRLLREAGLHLLKKIVYRVIKNANIIFNSKLYPIKGHTTRSVCVCVFFPSILDIKFVGRTRGVTQEEGHTRIFNPPSFCGACLDFCREKDSAIPFPRRP